MAASLNDEEEIFKKNLERYSFFSKQEADQISFSSFYPIFKNEDGGLNLKLPKDEILYSTTIKEESFNWFSKLNLNGVKVLYVFGIGLGAYYEACKEWLARDFTRFLIFIEDDKKMISSFLRTEMATEILHNSQCRLHYVEYHGSFENSALDSLTTAFLFDPYLLATLDFYKEKRFKDFENLTLGFSHAIYSKQSMSGEFLIGGAPYFLNFYENLKHLANSYLGNKLFNQFENIPAIICGAGPSLEKNIQLLKTLGDKALIIAGGTAVNALNSYHVFPHLTVGVDPNQTQLMRLLGNNAYETPFFYRNRIFPEALNLHSGEKLYVTGAGGYQIPRLFEKRFDVQDSSPIDEGYNVINFSVSIAKALGCNPIILCGMDLAYTNNQSYLPGIKFHALHNYKRTFITKGPQDELIGFKDIYGNSTTTLWKWINEASWYTYFAKSNPDITLINATEGGIGFPDIVNMNLEDVALKYFKKSYDCEGLIHAKIQNSHFSAETTDENVLKKLKSLDKSLKRCENLLKEAIVECSSFISDYQAKKPYSLQEKCRTLDTLRDKMASEDFGRYVLNPFADKYFWLFEKRMPYFLYDFEKDLKDAKIKSRIELELDCNHFLQTVINIHKSILENAIKSHSEMLHSASLKNQKKIKDKKSSDMGKLKTERNEHLLDGLSVYKSKSDQVLSRSFFEKGLKEGVAEFYYLTGNLFAKKEFKQGLENGLHQYYYEDGTLKSSISYIQGKLHGDVLLYYPNGKLKRQIAFKMGMREGIERMWNAEGQLLIEAYYMADKPCGISKWWYDNGVLKQEVRHDEAGYEIRCFERDGKEVPKEIVEEQDYFDKLIKMTNIFMESIHDLFQKADLVIPFLDELQAVKVQELKNDLHSVQSEIKKLSAINKDIQEKFSGNALLMEEPIWKSSVLQKSIDEQLAALIKLMKSQMMEMQQFIGQIVEKQEQKKNE